MGVILSSQACVCPVVAFLTGCTGNESCAIHVLFPQKGDPSVQAKCTPFERQDQSLPVCGVDEASWI